MTTCWGITDGSAGMAAQVKALAAALGADLDMKVVRVKMPWVKLPNICYATPLRKLVLSSLIEKGSDSLEGPFPDIIISCGRRAAIVTSALRDKLRAQPGVKAPYFVHIQAPQMNPKYFDLVVAMAHDKISAPNVIKTRYALHHVTPDVLNEARARWAPEFEKYPSPKVAVLIGGSTNKYTLAPEAIDHMIIVLERLLRNTDGSLLITPSRRTGEEGIARLRAAFEGKERVYIYDFVSENPYLGMLAVADSFVITNDSVNMMSEAAATGKPLHIIAFSNHKGTKPSRFAAGLIRDGIARPLGARLEAWEYEFKDEMGALAQEVRQRMAVRA
jgi:uncharacterized protein